MGLQLTSSDQVLALAPDSDSAKNAKKLALATNWKNLGQNSEALWGECHGSALYQIRVDLTTLTTSCSCPSRKAPCKHCLAILLKAVDNPKSIPVAEPPEWVVSWLAKRLAASKRKETRETEKPADAPPTAAQLKNAEKRLSRVANGLEHIDLWMNDLVRNGLATVETQPARFWEEQGKRMVDYQAAGINNRLRQMATIPNSTPQWPEKLLGELGKLALLTHSFRQIDQLEAPLQDDLRLLVIGKPLEQDEVALRGETVSDDWLILGQRLNDDEKLREQRTWMIGRRSERPAFVLQFAFGQTPFKDVFPVGAHQDADFTFYPGAAPLRTQLQARRGEILPITDHLPGNDTIEAFLAKVAASLARLPWQDRFLCTLRDVVLVCENNGTQWSIRDHSGATLPLIQGEYWQLLAVSGGMPVDFAGEWDGEKLFPLGVLANHTYYVL